MAFLVPLAVGALGLGTVGSALVSTALGIGLSLLSNKLKSKQKTGPTGSRVGLKIDTNASRQFLIGETATGGSLVFWHLSGANNQKLWMVIALADHECQSLEGVIVTGKRKTWNSSTNEVADYSGKLKVHFRSGVAGQTAASELVAASGGRWTTNEVGTGMCYVVVEADYDEKLFPEGIPEFGFVIRGAKLFDPRTSTTGYIRNSAAAVYALLRGVTVAGEPLIGMNVPAAAIRSDEIIAACNACDEDVALAIGGTEDRYQCNVLLDCAANNSDLIETVLSSMAGELIESGGIYRIFAGVSQSPVANLTDDDLISGEPFAYKPKRGRNALVNTVQGAYFDPARNYVMVGLPPRTSSLDQEDDGGIRLPITIDLEAVTSRTQAQRILEIERRKARRMGTASLQLRARWFGLEPGDWVTITSARRGFVSKTFVVESVSGQQDLRTDISLSEIDEEFDEWTTALEIADEQIIDLPPGGPTFATVQGVTLANLVVTGATSEQRPGLRITWTPVTDVTVIALDLEYRVIGDTVALQRTIVAATSGSYEWLDGVQGNVQYEARLKPRTLPDRTTNWTGWVQVPAVAAPQVVSAAALALAVPPDTITPAMLSAQSRFELALTTATDSVLGSISQQIADTISQAEMAHTSVINALLDNKDNDAAIRVEQRLRIETDLSLAEQITSVLAGFNSNAAIVQQTLTALAAADQTLAQSITTVATTANGNSSQVSIIAASLDGLGSKFGVVVSQDGYVLGLAQLAANAADGSTFTVISDSFKVALPGIAGGAPVPVFSIQNVNGTAKLAFRGDMYADGSITVNKLSVSQLSALTADLGTVTAGLIRNAANTLRFDLPTMRIYRTDGTMELNFDTKFFRIIF